MRSKPFLLLDGEATTRPVPRGWTFTPVGTWDGREAVVVHDPRRYDVIVVPEGIDDRTAHDLALSGWRRHAAAPAAWQARVNRRVVHEGTWRQSAAHAHDAIAYAHNHESLYGCTTSEGVAALLKLGAQAREDEPVAVRAYDLSVSVRPKGRARVLWTRDRLERTRTALDRASPRSGVAIETPGL